jgi:hypothetical protein
MTATSQTARLGSWASVHHTLVAVLIAVAVVAVAALTTLAILLSRGSSSAAPSTTFPGPSTPTQYCSNVSEPVPC